MSLIRLDAKWHIPAGEHFYPYKNLPAWLALHSIPRVGDFVRGPNECCWQVEHVIWDTTDTKPEIYLRLYREGREPCFEPRGRWLRGTDENQREP